MMYLVGTKELVLRIKVDHLTVLKRHIGTSYSINHDMKFHTGASLTLRVGNPHANFIKQKLNIKSVPN